MTSPSFDRPPGNEHPGEDRKALLENPVLGYVQMPVTKTGLSVGLYHECYGAGNDAPRSRALPSEVGPLR
jgi:hypothetical protein